MAHSYLTVGSVNMGYPVPNLHPGIVARCMNNLSVDVLCVQENRRTPEALVSEVDGGATAYVGRQPEGYSSQAVIVRKGLEVVAHGSVASFPSKWGAQIDWRRHVWAAVRDEATGSRPVMYISVHAPKRNESLALRLAAKASLRALIAYGRARGWRIVVCEDGNYVLKKHGDRMGLLASGLVLVAGLRIDHIWAGKRLRAWHAHQFEQHNKNNDHPIVTVRLAGPVKVRLRARMDTLGATI